jgi:hypothetical protein
MSEKKWTPGPWEAICSQESEYEGTRLVTAEVYTEKVRADMPGRGYRDDPHRVDNVSVCRVSAFQNDLSVEEIHAVTHLISAPRS